MIINKHNLEGYSYVSITLTAIEDKEILDKIKERAKEDAKNVNKRAPNGDIRPDELITYNNLGGVLAEEVVKLYLKEEAKSNNLSIKIYSPPFAGYLDHRDIKIEINGKTKTIEVRSSFQYKTSLQRVFTGAFSLIGQYVTSYKRPEPEKDFYIQVIHRYENPEIIKKIEDSVEVLIMGGGSKELFSKIGEKRFLKQDKAEYLVINPVNQTKGVNFLTKEILEIKEGNLASSLKQSSLF